MVLKRIEQCNEAVGTWADLRNALREFSREADGELGYTKLLSKCASVKGDEWIEAAKEISEESVKMNEIFREMLTKTDNFFTEGKSKLMFDASSSKVNARKCVEALASYRSLLKGKIERFGVLLVVDLSGVIISNCYERVNHPVFKDMWKDANWKHVVAFPDFIAVLRTRSTCSSETIDRFGAVLKERFLAGSLEVVDLNNLTSTIDSTLDLNRTVEALLPEKRKFAKVIVQSTLQALWQHNEEKAGWEMRVTINQFMDGLAGFALSAEITGIAKLSDNLQTLLKSRYPDDLITATNISGLSEDFPAALNLRETLERLVTELAPKPLPTPPSSPVPVEKTTPAKFIPCPTPEKPMQGKCAYCDKKLLLNKVGNAIGPKHHKHARECPDSPC